MSVTFTLISRFYLRLSLLSGLFSSDSPTNIQDYLTPPCVLPSLPRLNLFTLITFSADWKLTRYSLRNSLYNPDIFSLQDQCLPLNTLFSDAFQLHSANIFWSMLVPELGYFTGKQFTQFRVSHVKEDTSSTDKQNSRTAKQSQPRFLTWGPMTPRESMYSFMRSVNLDGGGTTTLFSVTSNWNLAFKSIMNVGNQLIYGL